MKDSMEGQSMVTSPCIRNMYLSFSIFVLFSSVFVTPTLAQLPSPAIATASMSSDSQRTGFPNAVPGCPDQSGILDSVSVPVGEPLDLVVFIPIPAPEGGARFRISSDDTSLVAVGDPRRAFSPDVSIPEGETTSNIFTIFGIAIGQTLLRIQPLTSDFVPSAFPLGAWDVSGKGLLDANAPSRHCRRAENSLELSDDEGTLAACGAPVTGIVADGVSHLLLRMQSGLEGTACFEVLPNGDLDQGNIDKQLVVTEPVGSLNQASSFYRSPMAFGDASANSRDVRIEFTYTPNIGNGNTTRIQADVRVVRPPVLLLHGIWSSGGAWGGVTRDRNTQFLTAFAADYENTNDSSFSDNADLTPDFVENTITASRRKGYATTQVDVIAHSMGGLLSRLHTQEQDYGRPSNLDEGDFHRLITLDTPHFGSNFANLLVALHRVEPAATEEAVADLVNANASPLDGAVCDLAENSPALQGIGQTSVTAHIITATGGPAGTQNDPALYWGGVTIAGITFRDFEARLTDEPCVERNLFFQCVRREFRFPQDIVNAFRFREQNDAIVPLSSQLGGLNQGSDPTTNFANLIHFGVDTFVVSVDGVTNTAAVATRAYQILDQPDMSQQLAASIPGVQSDGSGAARSVPGRGRIQDTQDFTDQCSPGGPMQPRAFLDQEELMVLRQVAADPRVSVTSPSDGQTFAPGDSVDVIVEITSPLVANDIRVRVPDLGLRLEGTDYDGVTYQASFVIPDAFAGSLQVIPTIIDTDGMSITGQAVEIIVEPTQAPTNIILTQPFYYLQPSSPSQRLSVTGMYSGNVERDISSGAAGTTYQSSNTSAVTVGANGQIEAVGPGTAVITVENQGVKAFATVEVTQAGQSLPPEDITNLFSIERSGVRLDRSTGFFVQEIRLRNSEDLPILGPLFMVISGLPNDVVIVNRDGTTAEITPLGSPYFRLPLQDDGLTLGPGQELSLQLQFLNPNRRRLTHGIQIFRVPGVP